MLCWPQDQSGFLMQHASGTASSARGVFTAGTVLGPMSIAESIGSAEQAVWDIIHFLDGGDTVGSKPKR
jgi:heterodisulfide reductase subunit A-like polyferredoxin